MKIRTLVQDCLYLNWALPAEALPPPPEPLRHELHLHEGVSYAFVSALLFRQHGMRLASVPMPRFYHPQVNLRLYVTDDTGVPGVLFERMLVPAWAVPGGWIAGQPLAPARFDFPEAGALSPDGPWRWSVQASAELAVEARTAAPQVGEGPRFANWETAVAYFRYRNRGYCDGPWGLKRIDTEHPRVSCLPVAAEVIADGLLSECFGVGPWPALHSAFLCPELPLELELSLAGAEAQRAAPAVAADPAMRILL